MRFEMSLCHTRQVALLDLGEGRIGPAERSAERAVAASQGSPLPLTAHAFLNRRGSMGEKAGADAALMPR